jgi:hypothetical protein
MAILFFAMRTTDKTIIMETNSVIINNWAGNSGTLDFAIMLKGKPSKWKILR